MERRRKAPEEQTAYAALLYGGMRAGLLVLLAAFALYVAGIVPAHVPLERLPEYWTHPVRGGEAGPGFLELTGIRPGWWWLTQLARGEFLSCVGIALLAAVTIGTCLRIVPILLRKGDRLYAGLALLEALVLALAASGLLGGRGY